jgi:hypothetical protein
MMSEATYGMHNNTTWQDKEGVCQAPAASVGADGMRNMWAIAMGCPTSTCADTPGSAHSTSLMTGS